MEYLYDGSFDGLLTCIYHHYYLEAATGIYQRESYQPTLLFSSMTVETDPALATRVYRAIEEKISSNALETVYRVYLSSSPQKENLILGYLRLGFRMGAKVDLFHSHPDVYPVHTLERKVTGEAHRLLGLVRFADTGSFLYAVISPDHHVLPLMADHFVDRLAGERWIINDKKRKLAIIYHGIDHGNYESPIQSKWFMTDFPYNLDGTLTEEEQYWQGLWQTYFQKISIASRYNPRLQSRCVPYRYRKHLVEFQALPPKLGDGEKARVTGPPLEMTIQPIL
ncbi:MAG: TIGR03915 family putative DNA repair protein [Bacillota bacterium]